MYHSVWKNTDRLGILFNIQTVFKFPFIEVQQQDNSTAVVVDTPRLSSTQDEIIWDLIRAVESACPAYTKIYILPIADKPSV